MDNHRLDRSPAKLLAVDANGAVRHLPRTRLSSVFSAGDLIVANDAATLPASLVGHHCASREPIEVRLAAWVSHHNLREFAAIAFGSGDHSTRTEDRSPPPPLAPGDRLSLGPLTAVIERLLDHPRLFRLRLSCDSATILAGLAQHGRPIQYAHIPEPLALWDVWTRIAADPIAFEAPSAGFAFDWRTLAAWRQRGICFTTLTHAAGISSTGDPALDARLPFDEPYHIPERTAAAIAHARSRGARIIAIGTSVVRALESAADAVGSIPPGHGIARGRIGRQTPLRTVDALLTGVHQTGDSHFELLRAFASDAVLATVSEAFRAWDYQPHEFGDSLLIERQRRARHQA
ncbi:S-adenosylmethionine:tRNA ribosyltransferase-isomerase [Bradyrhizobium sp.]|uniref:S-adenosylmethionine:tRNA ribosyltransferase-isomerase n=1 Tax=Bradyrhizobium sp. TaxID=376 RepID=UPI0025C1B3DD|nr:S-adenosylmethionine:tRNA ribosyltransferase-isomerase [Bradyrhizobium sp.]